MSRVWRTSSKRGLLPALRFFSVFVGVLSRALDWTRPAFWSPLQGARPAPLRSRRQEPGLFEQEEQVIEVDGLDEVGIEARLLRALPIGILSVSRHGHESQDFKFGPARQRRATS